jgi:vancomycin permeability regulator SanA
MLCDTAIGRRKASENKGAGKWILLGLVTAAFVIIYNAIAIYRFSQQDQTRKADCAIVAGAGITEKSPSPVFTARLDHAIWLYQEGKVNSLILTGVAVMGQANPMQLSPDIIS